MENYNDQTVYQHQPNLRYPPQGYIPNENMVHGHTHDSSGEQTPPGMLATPGVDYPSVNRPPVQGLPYTHFPSPDYGLAIGINQYPGVLPGVPQDAFDLDGMKVSSG